MSECNAKGPFGAVTELFGRHGARSYVEHVEDSKKLDLIRRVERHFYTVAMRELDNETFSRLLRKAKAEIEARDG